MRKILIYLSLILLISSLVTAVSVTRQFPQRTSPNTDLTITLIMVGTIPDQLLTVEEELPEGVEIKDWTITGSKEVRVDVTTRVKDNRFGWAFTPEGTTASISYTIDAGDSNIVLGNLLFFDSAGFNKVNSQTVKVAPITCGDGLCEGNENSDLCEADCPKPPEPEPAPPEEEPEVVVEPKEEEKPEAKPPWLQIILAIVIAVGIFLVVYFSILPRKKKKVEAVDLDEEYERLKSESEKHKHKEEEQHKKTHHK